METIAVVQARMGSTRLPGKIMKLIGNKPSVRWCVDAASRTPGVDMVVVATSVNEENDVLEGWCHANGVRCYRGSEDDVLDRYCGLIREYGPTSIVRITADCPFLDSHVLGELIALYRATKAPYATNQWPPTWPDGLDCEVINAQALLDAGEEATSQIDRDTVTQFIWRNQSRWPATNLSCPLPGLEKERWVLDSPEDYELLKIIAYNFPENWEPNYIDIWNFLNENPELRKLNRQWLRNQRFYEALTEEELGPREFYKTKRQLYRSMKVIPSASQTFSKSCLSYPNDAAPLFATHGDGAYIFDVDGNRYVDLVGALLPNVLGYNDPDVNFAIRQQLDKGISFSLATELETELAEELVKLIPCAESVRFGKNGSDATSAAVRLARYHTGRDRIGIIAGEGYHGWHDWAVAGTMRDKGVPGMVKNLTHRILPDTAKVEECLTRHKYAAVIIDPENHVNSFLHDLKKLCEATGALLIFDEIRTGFRYSNGGWQQLSGTHPHLACFGKSMGNGMPISALVGKNEYMDALDDENGPFWSGTFFGEALSLAAALATVRKIVNDGVIDELWAIGLAITMVVKDALKKKGEDRIELIGLAPRKIVQFNDISIRERFMKAMVSEGVLIINSNNVCYAMGGPEIGRVQEAYVRVIEKL